MHNNKWDRLFLMLTALVVSCMALFPAAQPVLAQETAAETAVETVVENAVETGTAAEAVMPENQLTLEDLTALNNGSEQVFIHDGRVTFVDGTCTDGTVTNMDEAGAVAVSMIELMGGDIRTQLLPWRTLTDASGNIYYVFRQMYAGTTVLGGAVKVITDAEGSMIALSCSVVSDLPEIEEAEGITAEEAEQIVLKHAEETNLPSLTLIEDLTDKIILPMILTLEDEDYETEECRFVWVVYSYNPMGGASGGDLPYLAHYVAMDGTYLYNLATILPGDVAGVTGFDSSYVFEFMEPADYTGYVDLSDGTEMELTVTLMRDKRTGMYYLGNIDRKIVVADCWQFLYNGGQVVLEYSPDNLEWDQTALLSFYNYCRAWDYYNEIGWTGADGRGTPILILNNYCDKDHVQVDNAAYMGDVLGWSVFVASRTNDFSQSLDVLAHEFTHCVTGNVMTYNAYRNDFGAINEAMSDIQGKVCEMMMDGVENTTWIMGDKSLVHIRSMDDPHKFSQPEYVWDLYYVPKVKEPTMINDQGGVHSNSSLLNKVAYRLISDGGMSLEEARIYWFAVDAVMVPGTDYVQLSELLPWVLKAMGMEKYQPTLQEAIDAAHMNRTDLPETIDENRALLRMTLPDNENFNDSNWALQIISVDVDGLVSTVKDILSMIMTGDYSELPPAIQEIINEKNKPTPVPEQTKEIDWVNLLTEILNSFDENYLPAPTPTPDPRDEIIAAEIQQWLRDKMNSLIFQNTGSAGQDGLTIQMMIRPGRVVPLLMHMVFSEDSMVPDQLVYVIYVNGQWIELPMMNADETEEEQGQISDELFTMLIDSVVQKISEIRSADDFLDLISTDVKDGEIIDISVNGLETLQLPEPGSQNISLDIFGEEVPGKKSRPKLPENL